MTDPLTNPSPSWLRSQSRTFGCVDRGNHRHSIDVAGPDVVDLVAAYMTVRPGPEERAAFVEATRRFWGQLSESDE